MKKLLYVILTLVILVIVGIVYMGRTDNVIAPNIDMATETEKAGESADETTMENATSADEGATNDTGASAVSGEIKTFEVSGTNFAFSQTEIRVKKGDTVRINFTSTDGFHDWVVDEFNAATERVQTGGNTSVEFVADQTGSFEYYCSVGSHRALGMKGTLIVE